MGKAKHFSAGIYLVRRTDGSGKYDIIGVTSKRFPNDVKLPGGTNENAPWENENETLIREFAEETGLCPRSFACLYSTPIVGKNDHVQHFFIVKEATGKFDGPKTVKEPDQDELTVRWWELGEFEEHLFRNHRIAFLKACRVLLGADRTFHSNYPKIAQAVADLRHH